MNTTTTALAIASSTENVAEIIRNTPQAYRKNQLSHDNCIKACEGLLKEISDHGMTDELDMRAAKYIDKSRRTVKAMKESRSSVTKLFDQVRKEFTAQENEIDPAVSGTAPFRLQQLRNQYAAKKHEEEERRAREEQARKQAELARNKYREDCTEDYKIQFNNLIVSRINELTELNGKITLDDYQAIYDTIDGFPDTLAPEWTLVSFVRQPLNLTPEEARTIRDEIFASLRPQFLEQYKVEIGDYRKEILDMLPSKKIELERAAKADAAEAARIKADIAKREAAEAARKEAERIVREQEEARKAQVEKAGSQAANLFDLARVSAPAYQPKAKVTKKIYITNPDGYLQVLMMWWAKEGSTLPAADLDKIFKKQISFCEKLANKNGEFIKHPGIEYFDDVKAQ